MEFIHTAIRVSDVEASKRFYIDGLGLEAKREFTGDDGVRNFYVGGHEGAQIQFKSDPDGEAEIRPEGVDHLAISVENVDRTVSQLASEMGYTVVQDPTDMDEIRFAYVEDPDGYRVELIQSQE
ncbi:VOC family protein [Salinigranum marinum]|uniref:VOC family protein n=1 Tax=Salinigranum marinum TaxID=1515595 RepID=UPI002989A6A0|nr:VOC family protein [Salinigranum marinum]